MTTGVLGLALIATFVHSFGSITDCLIVPGLPRCRTHALALSFACAAGLVRSPYDREEERGEETRTEARWKGLPFLAWRYECEDRFTDKVLRRSVNAWLDNNFYIIRGIVG